MASSIEKRNFCIGGIDIDLYRPAARSTLPIALVYLLHGRLGSRRRVEGFARKLVLKVAECGEKERELWVVTFDHRNHGSRLVNDLANEGWNQEEQGRHNPQHAVDMYSIQVGTARDVSFLTDFLPSYLFANGEDAIADWGVVGISLGGHSVWLALRHDARIRVGVAIIGCPDYLGLMTHRARQRGMAGLEAPHFPASLVRVVENEDPVSCEYGSLDAAQNPFLDKRVLVLSGADDELVPWSVGAPFVEKLESRKKESRIYTGVGHACTEEMEDDTVAFLLGNWN